MATEFQKRDIFDLSTRELKSHIREITNYRLTKPDWPPITANECNYLLMIAHGELQSKSSARSPNIALGIAMLSALLSATQLLLG